ncbi:SMI1/KNR4 family protein [Photobacterium chitinilyticum]|nr:SMI1/KNR4 family protein [Photobacterium chitinilyticum]
MKIRNLNLPQEMITAIQTGLLQRDVGSWRLKSDCDSYGQLLETELGEFFDSDNSIINATNQLSSDFVIDGVYGDGTLPDYPCAIKDITDFTHIICFGLAGDGSPFCLDYRSSFDEPSVIWWDDIYWRKVAPNFKEFLALFDTNC